MFPAFFVFNLTHQDETFARLQRITSMASSMVSCISAAGPATGRAMKAARQPVATSLGMVVSCRVSGESSILAAGHHPATRRARELEPVHALRKDQRASRKASGCSA